LLCVVLAVPIPRKRLAGPPEEFPLHTIPNPQDVTITERSITQNIYLTKKSGNDFSAQATIPVDGPAEFYFTFASPYAKYLTLSMVDPKGNPVDLAKAEIKSSFPIGVGNTIPTSGFFILNSDKGSYVLTIEGKDLPEHEVKKIQENKFPDAIISLINNDNLVIESFLNTYVISSGRSLGVNAKIVSADQTLAPQFVTVSSASLNVETPSGKDVVVPMNDKGVEGDVMAGDGVYAGQLLLTTPGQYVVKPVIVGSYEGAGAEVSTDFVRSTQHLVTVSSVSLELTGKANLVPKDEERMLINIGVSEINPKDGLRAYTEVWGYKSSNSNELVAVAWLGGLVDIENGYVTLELNARWLQRAGVTGDLVLRNTYIADVTTSFPIATFSADIAVSNSGSVRTHFAKLLSTKMPLPVTYEMRNGVNPRTFNKTAVAGGKKGIVLIPGYCATINPWSRNAKDFTDAYFFDDMNLNVPNDEYARKVVAFAEKQGLDSFGLIGHSQGGVVAAHIHNYYFTGLESATGPRPIQTVGTPYQGCTAAANAAELGRVFGVGCGANSDLSRDGAVNWLSGVSTDSRKDVYFFTTTYKRNTFFGDYCSAPMNALLQWPNDGVSELTYASLKGGVNLGNKDKWCHTTDMSYPAQYDDHERNKDMNAKAAR